MDDTEFRRGLDGEKQNGEDLVSGAEHLVRLRKQVGHDNGRDDDLTLEEEQEAARRPPPSMPKTAGGLKDILQGAREGIKYQGFGAGLGLSGLKQPGQRATSAGRLLGMAAPGAAVAGGAYAIGRHQGKKSEQEKTASPDLRHLLLTKLAAAREKTAGSIVERLKEVNPGLLAATGIGAAAGGLGTYLTSRPQKDTGKSKAEEELGATVEANKNKPERGLLSKMHNRNTELEHGYSKAFREHPVKAGIIGAATGGALGYGIGRAAGGLTRMFGRK